MKNKIMAIMKLIEVLTNSQKSCEEVTRKAINTPKSVKT